jgi:methyl-accepting chemotaxis protein
MPRSDAAARSRSRPSEARAVFEMNGRRRAVDHPRQAAADLLEGDRAILLLAYPKAEALAGAASCSWRWRHDLARPGAGAFATWRAAGRITQPLARLDEAAGRLATGEHVKVQVRGEDELARLAASFNEMVGKIEERERRITQLAFNDVLTGLPNRTMFQQQLEHLFRASRGRQARCSRCTASTSTSSRSSTTRSAIPPATPC